jgi:ABC-type polysaccharide/polyol phosphate transport system ATPase subunit
VAATEPAIRVRELWKRYSAGDRSHSLKSEVIGRLTRRQVRAELPWALQDVSFDIAPGEAVGVVGPNGSGKSTLLGILSRVLRPSKGEAVVPGRVCVLLEAAIAFHPDFTGIENIILQGLVLGMTRSEVVSRLDDIVAFADAGSYVDLPVRTYSRGQSARLGFAVAAYMSPDVFLIDEILAILDESFHHACYERLREMRERGCAVVFVSHVLEQVEEICDRTMWLEQGTLRMEGEVGEVLTSYKERFSHDE